MYQAALGGLLLNMIRFLAPLALAAVVFAGCTPASSDGTATDSGKSASTPTGSGKSASTTAKPSKTAKPKPTYTAAQENAIESAKAYLDMSGFSRAGLIEQLSSKAGDGYKRADAVFAVNHVKADWNKEAVEAAKAYLDMSSFSRAGLIEQLSSKAGDQFTKAQAEYAANKVGL